MNETFFFFAWLNNVGVRRDLKIYSVHPAALWQGYSYVCVFLF